MEYTGCIKSMEFLVRNNKYSDTIYAIEKVLDELNSPMDPFSKKERISILKSCIMLEESGE